MAKRESGRCSGPIDRAACTGFVWQGHQREVDQLGKGNTRPFGYFSERVPARQDDDKYFAAYPLCHDKIGHIIDVRGAQVGGAAANVFQYSAVNTLSQDDFNAGP